MNLRHAIALLAAAIICACMVEPSLAEETLRVGKAVPESFAFVPLDIGMHEGLFKRNGVGIDEIAFAGDAKLQQAMAADSLDIALGSGPAMAFIAKGAPTKAIAAMGGPPLDLTIVVRPDGPKSAADLKGKKISVSTVIARGFTPKPCASCLAASVADASLSEAAFTFGSLASGFEICPSET